MSSLYVYACMQLEHGLIYNISLHATIIIIIKSILIMIMHMQYNYDVVSDTIVTCPPCMHGCMKTYYYYNNIQTKSETGSAEGIESWNITNMMTPFKKDRQKESRRKKRLLELNVEVFGQNTSEADNTFIEV